MSAKGLDSRITEFSIKSVLFQKWLLNSTSEILHQNTDRKNNLL